MYNFPFSIFSSHDELFPSRLRRYFIPVFIEILTKSSIFFSLRENTDRLSPVQKGRPPFPLRSITGVFSSSDTLTRLQSFPFPLPRECSCRVRSASSCSSSTIENLRHAFLFLSLPRHPRASRGAFLDHRQEGRSFPPPFSSVSGPYEDDRGSTLFLSFFFWAASSLSATTVTR